MKVHRNMVYEFLNYPRDLIYRFIQNSMLIKVSLEIIISDTNKRVYFISEANKCNV